MASFNEAEPEPEVEFGPFASRLGDVPAEHTKEVTDFLTQLAEVQRQGNQHGFREVRHWVTSMSRIGSFSKEACLQLCAALTKCLSCQRPRGSHPSSDDLRQAFARMEGLKQIVNMMLLRRNDADVTAACVRLLAASVQNSPHAAEAISSRGADLRQLMRAIERHAPKSSQVAQAGCSLICHLCALPPIDCSDLVPSRPKAHRDSQSRIAQEGVLDVLASILQGSTKEVQAQFEKCERLQDSCNKHSWRRLLNHLYLVVSLNEIAAQRAASTSVAVVAGKKKDDGLRDMALAKKQESVNRARQNVEARQAWRVLAELEGVAGGVQREALQAMLVIATGNAETTRMLTGALATEKNASAHEPMAEPTPSGRDSIRPELLSMMGLMEKPDSSISNTLEALQQASIILLEVLRGRVVKDRPLIAAQACRVISVLVRHHRGLIQHIADDSRRKTFVMETQTRMRLNSEKIQADRGGALNLAAPVVTFVPLQPMVSALGVQLQLHSDSVPLVTSALVALADLRDLALLCSSAAVVGGPSIDAQTAWIKLLATNMQKGTFRRAGKFLREALHSTEVALSQMDKFKMSPDNLVGDGVYLTPRMLKAVGMASQEADELAADATSYGWKDGEPRRQERRADLKAKEQEAREAEARAARLAAGGCSHTPTDTRSEAISISPTGSSDVLSCFSRTSDGTRSRLMTGASKTSSKKKSRGKSRETTALDEEQIMKEVTTNTETAWLAAIGFEEEDNEDFERVWKKPLQAALTRSFSMPLEPRVKEDILRGSKGSFNLTATSGFNAGCGNTSRGSFRPTVDAFGETTDSLDHLLEVEYLESAPGRLKTRIVLKSDDIAHQNALTQRLRELSNPAVAGSVLSGSLSKHLRKSGCLLPKYGIQVNLHKTFEEAK